MSHGIIWTRVWTCYTPPLAGQTCASLSPQALRISESRPSIWKIFGAGHVITTISRRE